MFSALMGKDPEEFPRDLSAEAYAGWSDQDQLLRDTAAQFSASNFNLKTVVQALVLSPYFRADNTTVTDAGSLRALKEFGTGRLLSPEQLHRKLVATTGYTWTRDNSPALTNAYRLLYGGIDSDSVTERLTTPNGIMSGIMWRMGNEVSCRAVSRDFARPAAERVLFPLVTPKSVPENQLAEPDAEGKAAITENIKYLYKQLLGETVTESDAEFTRSYDLFVKTWREGRAKLAATTVSRNLPYECGYRRAAGASMDLPEAEQVSKDETYAIRAWMAVTSYMLTDYSFLYE
jgi:hypothetical protein